MKVQFTKFPKSPTLQFRLIHPRERYVVIMADGKMDIAKSYHDNGGIVFLSDYKDEDSETPLDVVAFKEFY